MQSSYKSHRTSQNTECVAYNIWFSSFDTFSFSFSLRLFAALLQFIQLQECVSVCWVPLGHRASSRERKFPFNAGRYRECNTKRNLLSFNFNFNFVTEVMNQPRGGPHIRAGYFTEVAAFFIYFIQHLWTIIRHKFDWIEHNTFCFKHSA